MNWRELYEYIAQKMEAVRQAIDVEPDAHAEGLAYDAHQSIEQSRAERFLQQVAQAVDVVLREEIIRTPSGKAYIPEKFVVYLNPQDDRTLQGSKREFVKRELEQIIFEEARNRAGDNKLTTEKLEIDLRVDATLEEDELRVSAIYDDKRELTVVADKEKTTVLGEKTFTTQQISEDKQTIFAKPLYSVEIWDNGTQSATLQVYKREATIGRGTGNLPVEIPLRKSAVSRRHAVLEFDDNNKFWLTHIGANPTLVNGEELTPNKKTLLAPNPVIEICGIKLRLDSA